MNTVTPAYFKGYNTSWNLNLFSGPKYTITCGSCNHTFQERIIVMDYPTVVCPACRAVNKIPLVVSNMGG